MPKGGSKIAFYAVARGRTPGVYSTWDDCELQVTGFPGARYKKFNNAADAEVWVASYGSASDPSGISSAPAPSNAPPQAAKSHPRASEASPSMRTTSRKKNPAEEVLEDETGWAIVYSDGACKGNGKAGSIAGVGVWWGRDDPRNLAERCPGMQTNNRAELIAIIRVLETAPRDKQPLLIKTDSQYCINCIRSWLPKWLATGFRSSSGGVVKNELLIRYLSTLLDQRGLAGQKVSLQYVRGHSGEEGNEGADYLANVGATKSEEPERDWELLRLGLGDIQIETTGSKAAKTSGKGKGKARVTAEEAVYADKVPRRTAKVARRPSADAQTKTTAIVEYPAIPVSQNTTAIVKAEQRPAPVSTRAHSRADTDMYKASSQSCSVTATARPAGEDRAEADSHTVYGAEADTVMDAAELEAYAAAMSTPASQNITVHAGKTSHLCGTERIVPVERQAAAAPAEARDDMEMDPAELDAYAAGLVSPEEIELEMWLED
ncbi:uncharacterized protein FIBRA_07332 [Fibroporia radiculosa]|uniref:Ribonuclease H n=1 Tax=Fibroporia radiculosa TaxID=599839 RepID=J4H4K0_9APHY|nr:uncharacterized protein FIBRA_07332 [Fibroporia radiculosa]CCM05124.1 predicted protein [Fibroporia radiculosa]